jgi:hypothetical protein
MFARKLWLAISNVASHMVRAIAYGATCQVEAGAPGLPLLVNVAPFISQM